MAARGERIDTPSIWLHIAPLPLLVVSVLLGWLLTPALIAPDRMQLSYAPTVVIAVLRIASVALSGRLRVGGPATVVGCLLHTVALLAAVAFNPFMCIYAFFGYLDADRFLTERAAVVAVVVTGLTCGFGQAGGLPGVTATPALFAVLAGVNVTIALSMRHFALRQERDVEARERAVEELAEAHRENLALQGQLLQQAHQAGISEERARLSRELHDTVAQGLVGVIRQLENLPTDLAPGVRQRVDRAEQTARECLTEARRAVRALGPHQLQDGDLPAAVRAVVERFSLSHDLAAEVRIDGTPSAGADDEVVLRVVQEALANVFRHARAGKVTVTLSWLCDELIVDVRDDGIGFHPDSVTRGRGLDGMAERLAAVGGRLEVESRPGAGSTVVAVLPRAVPERTMQEPDGAGTDSAGTDSAGTAGPR